MAYIDTAGDKTQLLWRTVKGLADFDGRSRRSEVIYYWFACVLVGMILHFPVHLALTFDAASLFSLAFKWLAAIPGFALLVRRLHDQDRSGWFGILLPLSLLSEIPRILATLRGDVGAIITEQTSPVGIASSLFLLTLLFFCWVPGTNGANRFGPDPRLV